MGDTFNYSQATPQPRLRKKLSIPKWELYNLIRISYNPSWLPKKLYTDSQLELMSLSSRSSISSKYSMIESSPKVESIPKWLEHPGTSSFFTKISTLISRILMDYEKNENKTPSKIYTITVFCSCKGVTHDISWTLVSVI